MTVAGFDISGFRQHGLGSWGSRRYYHPGLFYGVLGTSSVGAITLDAIPFCGPCSGSPDEAVESLVWFTAPGAGTGKHLRCGIYSSVDSLPHTLLADLGQQLWNGSTFPTVQSWPAFPKFTLQHDTLYFFVLFYEDNMNFFGLQSAQNATGATFNTLGNDDAGVGGINEVACYRVTTGLVYGSGLPNPFPIGSATQANVGPGGVMIGFDHP